MSTGSTSSSIRKPKLTEYWLHEDSLYVIGSVKEHRLMTAIWSVYHTSENTYTVLSMRPTTYEGRVEAPGMVRVWIVESTDFNMMYGTQITIKKEE